MKHKMKHGQNDDEVEHENQHDENEHDDVDEDEKDSCEECQWWKRDPRTLESFRHPPKNIAPSLQGRVESLDMFYQQMRYPPHCNL
jgi:hypothetical protein